MVTSIVRSINDGTPLSLLARFTRALVSVTVLSCFVELGNASGNTNPPMTTGHSLVEKCVSYSRITSTGQVQACCMLRAALLQSYCVFKVSTRRIAASRYSTIDSGIGSLSPRRLECTNTKPTVRAPYGSTAVYCDIGTCKSSRLKQRKGNARLSR